MTPVKVAILDILTKKPTGRAIKLCVKVNDVIADVRKSAGEQVQHSTVVNQLNLLRREGRLSVDRSRRTKKSAPNSSSTLISAHDIIEVSAEQRARLMEIRTAWRSRPQKNGKSVPPSKQPASTSAVPPLDVRHLDKSFVKFQQRAR
jgi:hypothetical protein